MADGDYATIEEVKRVLWPRGETPDDLEEERIQRLLTATSRSIDDYTGRRFYTTSSDETRYFTFDPDEVDGSLWVGDLLSVTTLKTDDEADRTYGTTWTTDDYDLLPANAALDSEPYTHVRRSPLGDYSFPSTVKGVQIVGLFGYSNVTDPADTIAIVKEACLEQLRMDFDNAGGPQAWRTALGGAGGSVVLHPDIKRKLDPLRMNWT